MGGNGNRTSYLEFLLPPLHLLLPPSANLLPPSSKGWAEDAGIRNSLNLLYPAYVLEAVEEEAAGGRT